MGPAAECQPTPDPEGTCEQDGDHLRPLHVQKGNRYITPSSEVHAALLTITDVNLSPV